jgi:hypothetical protein
LVTTALFEGGRFDLLDRRMYLRAKTQCPFVASTLYVRRSSQSNPTAITLLAYRTGISMPFPCIRIRSRSNTTLRENGSSRKTEAESTTKIPPKVCSTLGLLCANGKVRCTSSRRFLFLHCSLPLHGCTSCVLAEGYSLDTLPGFCIFRIVTPQDRHLSSSRSTSLLRCQG